MEENAIGAQRLREDILRTLVKRVLPALAEQLVVKNEVRCPHLTPIPLFLTISNSPIKRDCLSACLDSVRL